MTAKQKPTPRTREQSVTRGAIVLGFLAVALQRFGVGGSTSGTSVQLTTLILLFTIAWAILYAKLRVQARGILLFSLLVGATSVAAISAFLTSDSASMTSLILMIATYSLVLCAKAANDPVGVGRLFFQGAVTAVKLGSVLAVLQYFAQRAGAGFIDPLSEVPQQFLVSGYNTYWDLRYQGGVGQFKPNGVIFLEPSLLSLYSAIAIVFVMGRLFGPRAEGSRRANVLWLVVLAGGFAVSASASGFVVLGTAALPLLLSIRRNRALLIPIISGLVIAFFFGAFNSIIAKALEGFTGNTSTALRLTLPYKYLTPYWLEKPILGWGPGQASNIVADTHVIWGLQASTLMKLLVEYGLLGALALGTTLVVCLRRTGAPLYILIAMLSAWGIPAELLLSSSLVLLLLFAIPNWLPSSERMKNETIEAPITEASTNRLYRTHPLARQSYGRT